MEELQQKYDEFYQQRAAEKAAKERELQRAKEARQRAEALKRQYGHVKTGDLLGLDEKKEEDLLKFPSRDEELKGLFGGRGKKTRKSKKTRKTRKSRRRA